MKSLIFICIILVLFSLSCVKINGHSKEYEYTKIKEFDFPITYKVQSKKGQ